MHEEWFRTLYTQDLAALAASLQEHVGVTDDHKETGLMKAVRLRNLDMIKLLAPHEKRMTNNRGQTALILAAHFNYPEGCKALLPDEGDILLPSGCCSLIVAVAARAVNAVLAILPHQRYATDSNGSTALAYAAEKGYTEIVQMLLDADSRADKPAPDAVRALIVAVLSNQTETASFLACYLSQYAVRSSLISAVLQISNSSTPQCPESPKRSVPLISSVTTGIGTDPCRDVDAAANIDIDADIDDNQAESPKLLSPIPVSPSYVRQLMALDRQALKEQRTALAQQPDNWNTSIAVRERPSAKQISPNQSLRPRALDSVAVKSSAYAPSPSCVQLPAEVPEPLSVRSRPVPYAIDRYDSLSPSFTAAESIRPVPSPRYTALTISQQSPSRNSNRQAYFQAEPSVIIDPGLPPSSISLTKLPGLTALMTAVITGQAHLVTLLARTDAGQKTADGWTALMFAVLYNKLDALNILAAVEAGIQNNNGETALMIAAANNRTSAIIDLIQKESRIQDRAGRTALIHAVENGNYEAARMLCDNEHSISDATGNTAFLYACKNGNKKFTQLLVGLEGNKTDSTGQSGLMVATEKNHIELVRQLVHLQARRRNNSGITALMLAAYWNHVEIAAILAPVEMRETNDNGATALMVAAMAGSLDVCQILMSAEHRVQNLMGQTALMLAAAGDHHLIVDILAPYEAGMQDHEGRTALMYAAESQCFGAVKILSEKESGIRDANGCTAMMYAARVGSLAIIKVLMQYEQRFVDNRGHCALVYSTNARWPAVTDYLTPIEGDLM